MKKLILLTGASGFIGAAFLKRALSEGLRIRVVTRNLNNWVLHPNLEIIEGDLSSAQDWSRAVEGVNVVVHAAAEIKSLTLMRIVNVEGSMQLLDAAIRAGVKRWVQLSSVGAYGPVQAETITEEYSDQPVGPYEISKADFDKVLRKTAKNQEIEVCIIRPSNVYGPGMRNQSIRQMIGAIRKRVFLFVGPPGASANYVHVTDVVQALMLCVEKPQAANQTFIVSAWATMEEMVEGITAGVGMALPVHRIHLRWAMCLAVAFAWFPRWPLTLNRVQAMSLRSRYNTQKIENYLGWKLSMSVKEGMQRFARDFHP